MFLMLLHSGCNENKHKKEVETRIRDYMQTWTSHNIDKMVSYFTPDCIYEEVWSGRLFVGKDGVRFYAKETFDDIPDFTVEIKSCHYVDNMIFAEFVMSGNYPGGTSGSGIPGWRLKGSYVVELRNDSIFRVRDYWNMPGDTTKYNEKALNY
jgi:steroid delta-isomerase-like uncharacterized protein